jgi:hypothetical protein
VRESASINATRKTVHKDGGQGGGQADLAGRNTRLAQRIWEAFARHKWMSSRVTVPPWGALDESQRKDLISLSAEALDPVETS